MARSGEKKGWGGVGKDVVVGGGLYLGKSERVGHGADKDLTKLSIEVGTLDPVQVGVYPKNP